MQLGSVGEAENLVLETKVNLRDDLMLVSEMQIWLCGCLASHTEPSKLDSLSLCPSPMLNAIQSSADPHPSDVV